MGVLGADGWAGANDEVGDSEDSSSSVRVDVVGSDRSAVDGGWGVGV